MGKSAKFFKRPSRKEKAVLSLTKGGETSLFDSASTAIARKGTKELKKDPLSATANPTITKKAATSAHPPKASLAYKIQLNGGVKQAVREMDELEDDLVSEDEDMESEDVLSPKQQQAKGKKEDLDKTKPRPDYVELMYGRQGGGNKRKTFKPKPALIK